MYSNQTKSVLICDIQWLIYPWLNKDSLDLSNINPGEWAKQLLFNFEFEVW